MNKEITISIEEYKDLIRCKTLVDANKPTGIIMQTDTDVKFTSLKDELPITKADVKFAHWLKQKTTTANYEVWALTDAISTLPVQVNNAYLDVLDNGTTILSNEFNQPICVVNGSYAIFIAKDEE